MRNHDLKNVYDDVWGLMAANTPPDSNQQDDQYLQDFLLRLSESENFNDQRLLVCVAIDLQSYKKTYSEDLQDFISFIREVILETNNPSIYPKSFPEENITKALLFGIVLSQKPPIMRLPAMKVAEHKQYMRLTTFRNYLNYIIIGNLAINPDIPHDISPRNEQDIFRDFNKKNAFTRINIARLSSGNGWVYVASEEEVSMQFKDKRVTDLIDSFGLYVDQVSPDDVYIKLVYPPDFNEPVYQPTSLTGDWGCQDRPWGNDYFLTYPCKPQSNMWGSTFSVSGKGLPVKERVHFTLTLEDSFYPFTVKKIGTLETRIERNTTGSIIHEGLARYEAIKMI